MKSSTENLYVDVGAKGLKIMENYKTVRPNSGRGRL